MGTKARQAQAFRRKGSQLRLGLSGPHDHTPVLTKLYGYPVDANTKSGLRLPKRDVIAVLLKSPVY